MDNETMLRDKATILHISEQIKQRITAPCVVMEVCGTHTMSISRWGIKDFLPPHMKLISGPGCPVCVTDSSTMSKAIQLALTPDVIFTCFGDMMRVPAGDTSLRESAGNGADIRVVLSPLEALGLAINNPDRKVVFFAIGFETTAPLTAATLIKAREMDLRNFYVLCAHKTMPSAISALLSNGGVDALLCPGHVAAITGAKVFSFIPDTLGKPAAISGFEPVDIMLALGYIAKDISCGKPRLTNCYPRTVKDTGNQTAKEMMEQVFCAEDAVWRGLGNIPASGLALRPEYKRFDALTNFTLDKDILHDNPNCCCGDILRGKMTPLECPLFGVECTPESPCGACMVSSEGACSAAFRYERKNRNEI